MSADRVAVVLAGGVGARFWPLSRELGTKQLLGMFGSDSLIADAISRGRDAVGKGQPVLVVTGELLLDELRNAVCASPDAMSAAPEYLIEPMARGTAAAVAIAAISASVGGADPVLLVLPSDHVAHDRERWQRVSARLLDSASGSALAVLAFNSLTSSTYGYLEIDDSEEAEARVLGYSRFRRSVEEQTLYTGVWAARASTLVRCMTGVPGGEALLDAARQAASANSAAEADAARVAFSALPVRPIEDLLFACQGIERAAVIEDPCLRHVASFDVLRDVLAPDDAGNVRQGRGTDVDSRGCIVYAPDRLVATLGLRDVVVIDSADAVLVCARERVNDVREVVSALKDAGAEEITYPRTSQRPWGTWTSLLRQPSYQMKVIEVRPGARLSLQSHQHRSEHWIVVKGSALVTRDGQEHTVGMGESIYIPAGAVHRLENCGDDLLEVVEVQVGEYLREDDIVRYEDDFQRG